MKIRLLLILLLSFAGLAGADLPKAIPDKDLINVDFPDESRASVLISISQIYDLDVVYLAKVPGRVRLKLRDRDWRQLFDEVLHPVGFAWREENGVIRIYDALPDARAGQTSQEAVQDVYIWIIVGSFVALAVFSAISLVFNVMLYRKIKVLSLHCGSGANKSVEVTPTTVTTAADAPVAPVSGVPHH